MWLVLIISIEIAAISATLVGRYSCTLEWQGYKTLTSSLTNLWAVILGVPVSTIQRTPSQRSLLLALVCFSVVFSTALQAFLTTFLKDSGYNRPIQNMEELFASGMILVYTPQLISFRECWRKGSIKMIKISWEMSNERLHCLFGLDNITQKYVNFYIRFSCWIKLRHC